MTDRYTKEDPRFFSYAWYVDLAPRWGGAKDLLRALHAAAVAADVRHVMRQAETEETKQ